MYALTIAYTFTLYSPYNFSLHRGAVMIHWLKVWADKLTVQTLEDMI